MPTYNGADGARLHFDVLYRGSDDHGVLQLITLAGGAARHPSYLGDLAGLDGAHQLVVPHLRGVGRSPLPDLPEAASYWRQAEDLDHLRVHLGLEQVHLMGHSAGTRLAIGYATQFPDRVASMVLIAPPAGYLVDVPSDADQLAGKRRGEPAFDAALAAAEAGPAATDDATFNSWWYALAPLGYASWGEREQAHAAIGHVGYAANRAFFSVDPPPDLAGLMTKVTAPVLVVAGAQDCSTGVAPVVALSELFPTGRLAMIEGSGHHSWVEQPVAFRAVVDEFLAGLARV